jgi:hypothetical protein
LIFQGFISALDGKAVEIRDTHFTPTEGRQLPALHADHRRCENVLCHYELDNRDLPRKIGIVRNSTLDFTICYYFGSTTVM